MSETYVGAVKTDAFEMEYIRFGGGKKNCVIIPGMSMKSVIPSAGAVAVQYRIFADDYTVYLFDRKKDIKKGYTVHNMADDTAAAMKSLGIKNADVIGASQGGMIAECIAVRYPELVHKLALCSTLARHNSVSEATFAKWIELSEAGDAAPLNRDVYARVYSREYRDRFALAFASLEKSGTPEEVARFGVLAEACRSFDIYSELSKIKCPILAVGSENDEVLSPIGTREIAEKTGCRMIMLDSSHAAYDEIKDYPKMLLDFFAE